VTKVVVCDPRQNALLQVGNKSDRINARKLAELLRAGLVSAVSHGPTGLRTLKELSRCYLTINKELTRTMNRLKALYRSWNIPCAGPSVCAHHRAEWLGMITQAGVRRRAELLYQELDGLQVLGQAARHDLLAESRKHGATKLFCQIPYLGPIRAALLIALVQTPRRFCTKRQLWAYSGLALETHSSGEYRYVQGRGIAQIEGPGAGQRLLPDYKKGCTSSRLDEFIAWFGLESRPGFTEATVNAWRGSLEARGLASVSVNVRITAVRKQAVEAADNGLLAPELAAGIARVKGAKSKGVRLGNWLSLVRRRRSSARQTPRPRRPCATGRCLTFCSVAVCRGPRSLP
jgi:hypothetical protein